jgi:hypothetical protein
MKIKGVIKAFFIVMILSLSVFACRKNDQYIFTEDPAIHRKDSIARTLINVLNTDSIKSTINWLQGMGTRFAFANNHRQVAVKIRDKFIRMGYTDTFLDSFLVTIMWRYQNYSMWEYNVVASLHGSSHPDSVNIIGAHYDDILTNGDPITGAPGANDNASGVSAMIEIARVMKVKNYSPPISILFVAFGAEELGLLGSADFASKIAYSGRPVKFMINNDMIAYPGTSDISNWTVNIMSYPNSEQLCFDTRTLCNSHAMLNSVTDTTKSRNSDSYSFFKKGFQAVYVASKTIDPNYHTINDIAYNCNFNFCTRVTAISCALLVYSD